MPTFSFILGFSVYLCLSIAIVSSNLTPKFRRDDFPSEFVFGAGTSAYQVEGAVAEDGRSPCIWDTYTHDGKAVDNSTADIAADEYHKYKEDVKLMSELGLEAYRFSISWSRLIPNGRGEINPKGLKYYNNLINELINRGIQPHVTLCHLDLPQILDDEYAGWLSPKIIEDFTAYAEVCFREFGNRVAHWTTINEPNSMSTSSYDTGRWPPQRCTNPTAGGDINCTTGNSSTEPYIAMHNALLAHASAAAIYKEKYQGKQKGVIGLNAYAFWCTSFTNSSSDIKATHRAREFLIGWTINPLVYGDYPDIMRGKVGSRLPHFTKQESELIKRSWDFIGLNHYYTVYIEDDPKNSSETALIDYFSDMGVKMAGFKDNTPVPASQFSLSSSASNPPGLLSLLNYMKDSYGNPPIYVQENGYGAPQNESLNDIERMNYVSGFIENTLRAIRNGANAKGYFVWSFLDVYEVLFGYQSRYGLVHVDLDDNQLKRTPKLSALWYSNFLKKKRNKFQDINIENKNVKIWNLE
ncbi:hypothetical protein C5167_031633 [Papaver somniferum]|uniref:Beta-glucosidase n=1 Tax=Papaver somniferum TaxID=3469 RepID=A0A4Y7K6C1_PAPSO|nr:cyanidin 3-O-glucoside 7-O-glucosyltransferase (acyl-glucose)-like [Papaver somniferum]RZC68376.1 hypothetical protein C5167_031633 [Papaver somniferum]